MIVENIHKMPKCHRFPHKMRTTFSDRCAEAFRCPICKSGSSDGSLMACQSILLPRLIDSVGSCFIAPLLIGRKHFFKCVKVWEDKDGSLYVGNGMGFESKCSRCGTKVQVSLPCLSLEDITYGLGPYDETHDFKKTRKAIKKMLALSRSRITIKNCFPLASAFSKP